MTENDALPEFFEDGAFDEINAEINTGVAEAEFAILIPTGGQRVILPISRDEEGNVVQQTIFEAAVAAELQVPPSTQFYVDGNLVEGSTHIQPNMQVTAVGNVKGG